jgi:hypothetical protein
VSGVNKEYIVTELVVEENTISSAGEKNGGGGHPSGSMTGLCEMEKMTVFFCKTNSKLFYCFQN